ncbi:hypothetical protein M501DRAFT_1010086 [Patellaria atrata CBS 101060]|uniref:MARVEL domain-containing protein n=1 Tax=Patellaria atrata CBS 101060 TaxID=1346257 RepID=A0A9P4SFK3_9PEZI|nr:hypothetical protein M501DRAFT_1010086 [Patellaria atrata CBS 101060]
MPSIPSYGAAPLSATFLIVRVLALISMVTIVGLMSDFVSKMVTSNKEPPKEVVGALSVTCIATLYTLVSISFYWAQANLGLLVMAGLDGLILIAWIVVAVSLGKPLSYLNCYVIGDASAAADAQAAYAFAASITDNINVSGSKSQWELLASTTKTNCFESKAAWGLSIALCILFTTSCALLPTLFMKNKKANAPAKAEA